MAEAPTLVADIAALDWRPIVAGLSARSLHVDPQTGARVALIRMTPEEGYVAPPVAHYHETYEEILGLQGRFTFDGRVWLGRASYVLHPAGTVHGFASAVVEDSVFLSRVGPGHKALLVPEPEGDEVYSMPGFAPARAALAVGDPAGCFPVVEAPLLGTAARWRRLGAGSPAALVELSAGWAASAATCEAGLQIFVLDGTLDFGGTRIGGVEGGFLSLPAGSALPAITASDDALLFVAQGTPEPIA